MIGDRRNTTLALLLAAATIAVLGVALAQNTKVSNAFTRPGLAHPAALGAARAADEALADVCVRARTEPAPAAVGLGNGLLARALGSLPEPRVTLSALDELLARAEERSHPLLIALDEPDAADARVLSLQLWPRVTAARAWFEPDLARHDLELASCSDPAARFSLWGITRPAAPRDVRHAAWAISYAAVLRTPEPEKLAERLRRRSVQPDTTIGLILVAREPEIELSALAVRAEKLLARARGRGNEQDRQWLSVLANSGGPSGPTKIALGPDQVVVVPRLGATARLDRFATEVDGERDAQSRWKKRPELQ